MSFAGSQQLFSIICVCRAKRSSEKRLDVPCRRVRRAVGNARINNARRSANDGEIIDDPLETSFQFSLEQSQEFPQVLNCSSISLNVHLFQIREIIKDQISIKRCKILSLFIFKIT